MKTAKICKIQVEAFIELNVNLQVTYKHKLSRDNWDNKSEKIKTISQIQNTDSLIQHTIISMQVFVLSISTITVHKKQRGLCA